MRRAALLLALLASLSCGADESLGGGDLYVPRPPSVPSQGRGFGQLRAIIAAGEVPQPSVLSLDVFLDEHAPAPSQRPCASPVCLYAARGLGPDLRTGVPRAWIALSLRPGPQRPAAAPPHLIIAVDTSSSMAGPSMDALKRGLLPLIAAVGQGSLQLVRYGDEVTTHEPVAAADASQWVQQVSQLSAAGGSDLQGGLRAALDLAIQRDPPARVLFIADGASTRGITEQERLLKLADSYGAAGVELSTLGIGNDFPSRLLHDLQQRSLGSFYHIDDLTALDAALSRELNTSRQRLAQQLTLDVALGATSLVAAYGADVVEQRGAGVTIRLNAAGAERRGGQETPRIASGANVLLLELEPRRSLSADEAVVTLEYVGFDGELYAEQLELDGPQDWERARMRGEWDDRAVERFAVVMSVYGALSQALEDYARGDAQRARQGLERFIVKLEDWLRDRDEQDIYQDLLLLRQLSDTIRLRAGSYE